MVEQLWEPIPISGFSWYEWCEADGLVRSWKLDGTSRERRKEPRVLRGGHTKGGYKLWGLYDDSGKQHGICLHQLVCSKYHGPKQAGMEVCHNDGNPKNNAPENLRWDTAKANAADRAAHGTFVPRRPSRKGKTEKKKWKRLSKAQAQVLWEMKVPVRYTNARDNGCGQWGTCYGPEDTGDSGEGGDSHIKYRFWVEVE